LIRAAFSASSIARIAYAAGCTSSTKSDSPASTMDPCLLRLTRNACCGSSPAGEDLRRRGVGRGDPERLQHRVRGGLYLGGAAVDLQVAELPLDDQQPGLHGEVLDGDVGQGLDVQAGGHLDDLRRGGAASRGSSSPNSTSSAAAAGR